ncbi:MULTISPECIES: hypothetical protein [Leptospira]|uniref:Uncharacterized protein n=1 Tax=Leptospira limi TaxID=2950023 RepID=A0ABT3M206_9LEPT|nr:MULTISPECIES: hypothetical protein [Leptospira]MCW7464002.1 hypothetical protein [Leptospira limi]TGK92558.1 hypothetical protein EHQ34_18260 [Leptospira levettii]
MKLLKIENNNGFFRLEDGNFKEIDALDKEGLLSLVNWTFDEDEIEYDEFNDSILKNQAHQIIYKSIYNKLRDLRNRRKEYLDETAQLYLADYTKYRDSPRQ